MAARPTLKRRILFFQVLRDGEPVRRTQQFNFARTFAGISLLPNTLQGRQVQESEDASVSCFVDSPNCIRLGRIRSRNLPGLVLGEDVDDIPVAVGGGILEVTHLQWFNSGIIGAAFNFYAPRVTRLPGYIAALTEIDDLEVLPIIKHDAVNDLRSFESLHRLDLKVATTAAAVLRRRPFDILGSILGAGDNSNAATITFSLTASPGRNNPQLDAAVRREALALAERPNLDEIVKGFKVQGYNADSPSLDTVDMLDDELVGRREVVRENARGSRLNDQAAYETIAQVYRDIRPDRYLAG